MSSIALPARWFQRNGILLVLVTLLTTGCGSINTIPTYQEQVKASWSEVLNQYQRRADLIPNLVETVKGYATQEKDVLTSVVEARAKATQMQIPPDIINNPGAFKAFQENQAALSSSLARLLAVVENYPDLKSNQNFLALQAQLEGTENRIAVARRDYIEAVRQYNTELKTFPGRIWAWILYSSYQPAETFTIKEEAMQPPKVDFSKQPQSNSGASSTTGGATTGGTIGGTTNGATAPSTTNGSGGTTTSP